MLQISREQLQALDDLALRDFCVELTAWLRTLNFAAARSAREDDAQRIAAQGLRLGIDEPARLRTFAAASLRFGSDFVKRPDVGVVIASVGDDWEAIESQFERMFSNG